MAGFWMPRLAPHRVHLGVLIALAAAAACTVLLYRSVMGFEMRAADKTARRRVWRASRRPPRPPRPDVERRAGGPRGRIEVSAITHVSTSAFHRMGLHRIAVVFLAGSRRRAWDRAGLLGALDAGSTPCNAWRRLVGVGVDIQANGYFFLVALERDRWLRAAGR